MIHCETLPSDALKVGLIKISLETLVIKCSLVHDGPGTTIFPIKNQAGGEGGEKIFQIRKIVSQIWCQRKFFKPETL